jgi:hypothetical protein
MMHLQEGQALNTLKKDGISQPTIAAPCSKNSKLPAGMRTPLPSLFLIASLLSTSLQVNSQRIDEGHALYYQKRGNRYEGIYNKELRFLVNLQHNHGHFAIAGFTIGRFYYSRQGAETLTISSNNSVDVVARSFPNDLPYKYRLDGQLRERRKQLTWPTADVLANLKDLNYERVGIFAIADNAYVPVQVGSHKFKNDSICRLYIIPKVNVVKIRWRLLADSGAVDDNTKWTEVAVPIEREFYRAGFPIIIKIPLIHRRTMIEIQAKNRDKPADQRSSNFVLDVNSDAK